MDVDFVVAVEQQENENDQKLEQALEQAPEIVELEEAELEITHQIVILLARLRPGRRLAATSLANRILNQME